MSGVIPGSGVTHTSFLICSYFTTCRKQKTAYIKMARPDRHNGNSKMFGKQDMNHKKTELFAKDCYFQVMENELFELYRENYQNYIIDFGAEGILQPEFLRCDYKFIMIDNSLWRRERFECFMEQVDERDFKEMIPIILYGEEKEKREYQKMFDRQFYRMPFHHDPVHLSLPVIELFHTIFE